MSKFRIIKQYISPYTNPIRLETGETVILGDKEAEEKWKGWIWAKSKTNEGWIPVQIVEFSEDGKTGIIKENYSAKELNVEAGDEIIKIRSLNGWTWSEKLKDQEEGWIPDEIIE